MTLTELKYKKNLSNVFSIYEKPSGQTEGLIPSDFGESEDRKLDKSILAESPNSYKQNGESMSYEFIKYLPCERSKWLRKNYPNAFLVLSVIAERARWSEDKARLDGLEIGDAVLGRKEIAEAAGLTEDQARTALEKLEEFHYIETVFSTSNSKKVKKRPIKIPTKARVVNIRLSDVWDVERKINPQQNPQPIPTSSPPDPHKQDSKIDKKDRILLHVEKNSFGSFVKLKKSEYDDFVSKHSKKFIDDLIDRMNDWIEATGKPYKNYAAALRMWITKDKSENSYKKPNQRSQNYEVDTRPVQYNNTMDFSEYV